VLLDAELRAGLGVALNEAKLLDFVLTPAERACVAWFEVLTLPPSGPAPADRRVQLQLSGVGRLVASVRTTSQQSPDPPGEPFGVDQLSDVVRSFGGQPVYGWEFFDRDPSAEKTAWMRHPSLDWTSGDLAGSHWMDLFQEEPFGTPAAERQFDLRVWFERLNVADPAGTPIELAEFVRGGRRWWAALDAGDPRTEGHGIFPIGTPRPGA